jgi:hypothetical protein
MTVAKAVVAALKAKGMTPREAMKLFGLDEALLTRENIMTTKPTRLAAAALRLTARAVNPLLAMDAKVDYLPVFQGLNSKNFKAAEIVAKLRPLLKGKTIAKDAGLEHVEGALKKLEEPHEGGDESVSEEQHRAMEAAAHGQSNLGIPKEVGKEFSEADKGKTFDAVMDWLRGKGMSDDDLEHLRGMMPEPAVGDRHGYDVHHYHGARDESEEEEARRRREKEAEDRHPGAKDAKHHHHYANDESEEERRARETKEAEDRARGARDKMVTKDEIDANLKQALETQAKQIRQNEREIRMALDEAKPLIGELRSDLVFDTADDVRRHVLKARGKKTEGVNSAGLKQMVEMLPPANERTERRSPTLGMDESDRKDLATRFPGSDRITRVA